MDKYDTTFLGFDYGTSNVAMAIITKDGYDDTIFTYFKKLNTKSASNEVHRDIRRFLTSETGTFEDESVFTSHVAYIESAFKGPNINTFQGMVRVAHSIDIILSELGVECHYIDNNTWRKILFDKGNTKKEVAQEWAYEKWPFLLDYPKSQRGHLADALCIAEAGRIKTEKS